MPRIIHLRLLWKTLHTLSVIQAAWQIIREHSRFFGLLFLPLIEARTEVPAPDIHFAGRRTASAHCYVLAGIQGICDSKRGDGGGNQIWTMGDIALSCLGLIQFTDDGDGRTDFRWPWQGGNSVEVMGMISSFDFISEFCFFTVHVISFMLAKIANGYNPAPRTACDANANSLIMSKATLPATHPPMYP